MDAIKLTSFQVGAIKHAKVMADEMGITDKRDRNLAILDLTLQIMQNEAIMGAADRIAPVIDDPDDDWCSCDRQFPCPACEKKRSK